MVETKDNLNPRYTFDSLIVGDFNELPYAAGKTIIRKPGRCYNPLYVYGKAGVGKTHLLQAIGNQIKKTHKDKKILYIMAEDLVRDLVDLVKRHRSEAFGRRYKKYDILIVDGLESLKDKEKTQEELMHLFAWFWNNNKQVILSSNCPPDHLPKITDYLRTYCVGGMIVDISAPDKESCAAILKAKAKMRNFPLSQEILKRLSSSTKIDIRKLEGALNNIICQSKLKKES